jgi:hypothetical protein
MMIVPSAGGGDVEGAAASVKYSPRDMVTERAIKLDALPAKVRARLTEMDRDRDGDVDEEELVAALDDFQRTKSENRIIRHLVVVLVLLLMLTVGSITYLVIRVRTTTTRLLSPSLKLLFCVLWTGGR